MRALCRSIRNHHTRRSLEGWDGGGSGGARYDRSAVGPWPSTSFSTSTSGFRMFMAGYFLYRPSQPMLTGLWCHFTEGSNFQRLGLFGSGYAGLGLQLLPNPTGVSDENSLRPRCRNGRDHSDEQWTPPQLVDPTWGSPMRTVGDPSAGTGGSIPTNSGS